MPVLQELINNLNVSTIKEMFSYLPNACKGRKEELVSSVLAQMAGTGLLRLWEQLDPCQRLAVEEATFNANGAFDGDRFVAKYGKSPSFHHVLGEGRYQRRGDMTVLGLFLFRVEGRYVLPTDLQERLQRFVQQPAPNALATLAALPEPPPDLKPMTERNTASDALQDLMVMLRAVDQGLITVSDKTRLPGSAAIRAIASKLANGDFYTQEDEQEWTESIGPIKAFAWPMLLQATDLAQLKGSKLAVTPAGVEAMTKPPADAMRDAWRQWLKSNLHDEFGRVDNIKGQKPKENIMSATAPRRAAIDQVLRRCPVDSWVGVDELSRFMQAEGVALVICHEVGRLYIEDPNYGSLYYGQDTWNLLQLRYLLCVLFEYCATLGMVDVAYLSPHGARDDFADRWGTDEMSFLSRYDGLMYFRLNALGAYCLGISDAYTPVARAASCTLAVRASLQISITAGALSADEVLMLDTWALQENDMCWRLDREKAIAAIERGHEVAPLEAFLEARDNQPLPVQVSSFLRTCSKQGKALKAVGQSLLIECADANIADQIAAHKDTAGLCMRAGERHLVVLLKRESKFRKAIRLLGYGMPGPATA